MERDTTQEILERVVRIETKIDGYNNLREKLDRTYSMACNNKEKITEMKDNTKWLWRTIAGIVIAGVASALITLQ